MPEPPPESIAIAGAPAAEVDQANTVSPVQEEVVELFDQLRDRLLRYLLGCSLANSDSEDIVQETFLALFEHLRRGRSRQHLRGWLFRVAHNLALKHRRNQKDWAIIPEPISGAENWVVDPSPNPEDQCMNNQRQKRLLAIVRELPDQNRWCLYLRAEGLRYREIAEVLDISLGSVSVCLERSLSQIRRALER
ncbi:MAG: sigma-70 family RNA polymerase sigma factor [Bryobacteraceae bacterium]